MLVTFLILGFLTFGQNNSGKIILLHTNDIHGSVAGLSPELDTAEDDSTVSVFLRIAGIIEEEKAKNPECLLVLDAGDFLMGTFFHALEGKTDGQLNLMKKIGYDAISLGNHELDYGPEPFAGAINSARINGEIPKITLSNVKFSKKSEKDNSFEQLYKEGIIAPYHICEVNGLKAGVFGILGKSAKEATSNTQDLTIANHIKTAKKIVKKLRKDEKADFVICLSHSGVYRDKKGNWTGEDVLLAKKVKGIDVIISAHTCMELSEPVWIDDVPIVQAGSRGKNVGRFEINVYKGKISSLIFSVTGGCHFKL